MGAFLVGSSGCLPLLLNGCAFISCRGGGGERDLKRKEKRKDFYGTGGCIPFAASVNAV
jgi:hypothetical protein